MLESLHIIDYALIDDLTVEFKPGLNIFTGSTGAGKTIIFGALGLALGEKTSNEIIRTAAKSAAVEAEFSVDKKTLIPVEDIDENGSLIIRREVKKDGRSRAYINNKLTTIQNLKLLGTSLTDIVGQHRQKGLTDPSSHRQILDHYAGSQDDLKELSSLYRKYYQIESEYKELENKRKASISEKELLEFQINEIESASLVDGEDEKLKQEKIKLINAEKVKTSCRICFDSLFNESGSASERLKDTIKEIGRVGKFSDQAESIKNKVEEQSINLDEIGIMLRELSDSFEFEPERLEIIEDRIIVINKLKRKYGQSIDEILKYFNQAKAETESFENLDEKLKQLTDELKTCRDRLSRKALAVSLKRKDAANTLEKEVIKHLSDLAMKGADFKVGFEYVEALDSPFIVDDKNYAGDEAGYDNIEFLICPNPGENLKPLATTASGGELSRLLLAICSALVDVIPKDTLVFDEIDAGISGEVASQVGKKLLSLAKNRQIICITHLQQLASLGEAHFKVYKGKNKGRSVTRIKMLKGEQRVAEIARLLAGEKISDIALEGAARLLKEGQS